MTDVIYVGGKVYVITRAEGSNTTPANYGTYASGGTDDKGVLATNFNASLKNNMIQIYTLGGGRSFKQIVPGKFEASGTLEYEVGSGNFLKYAFGAVSAGATTTTNFDGTTITGTPTAALKKYVLTQADTLDSFSMDVIAQSDASASDVKTRYTGAKANQVTLKADTENPLHATMDFIAQKPTTSTADYSATTQTILSDVPQMFYRGQLLINAGDYGLSGTGTLSTMTDATKAWTVNAWQTNYVLIDSAGTAFVITSNTATALTVTGTPATGSYVICPLSTYTSAQVVQCNSVDMTLTNNLEGYWSISNDTGRGVKYLLEKQREYTLTLDLNFVNTDQLGRFYSGATSGTTPVSDTGYTPFCVVLDYKTAIGQGDNYKALKLVFTDVVFDEESLPANPKDILKQVVTAKAKNCMGFFITSEAQ